MTGRPPTTITWTPLHPSLPEWRSYWTSATTNQLLLRISLVGGEPRITHLLLLGDDIRTADIQEIPLGRIIQMINAGTPPLTVAPANRRLVLPDGTVIDDDDLLRGYLTWLTEQASTGPIRTLEHEGRP